MMKRLMLLTNAALMISLCFAQKKSAFCICIIKKEAKKVIREIKDSTWKWNLKYPESTIALVTNADMCIGLYLITCKSTEDELLTLPVIRMKSGLFIRTNSLEKNLSVLDEFKSFYKNIFSDSEIMIIEKRFLAPIRSTGTM